MKSVRIQAIILICITVTSAVVWYGFTSREQTEIPVYHYEVINTYPHDPFAFTEGLTYSSGTLVEGTGLRGNSDVREVNLATGEIIRIRHLPAHMFGEGVTFFGSEIAQVTLDSGLGMIYERENLSQAGTFSYSTRGWGLTWDHRFLVMSDGTSFLYFIDPATFREVKRIEVRADGKPVKNLNELEYVRGEIYANVWPTDMVARISPTNGNVTGWIDLNGLLPVGERERIGWAAIDHLPGYTPDLLLTEVCPNGIAYDPTGERLFVTGKLWPELFEIRVVPA